MNTDELEAALYRAERRVLEIQAKLHRWAIGDRERRFDDLFNLVTDPAFLLVAWDRVRGNRGASACLVDSRTGAPSPGKPLPKPARSTSQPVASFTPSGAG